MRDYGVEGQIGLEATPSLYVERLVEVFREVRRVLHPSGSLFLNLGDSFNGSGAMGAPDKQATNRGSQSKPDNRSGYVGSKCKDLLGIPWSVAFALREDGWYLRQRCPWVKRNCLSGGTWLYARTQKGEMPVMVKDLVRLDPKTVRLWNGQKWTKVVAWWRNENPTERLELVLRSGERIGCTGDHLWPTQRGNVKASELKTGDVIQSCQHDDSATAAPEYLTSEAAWFIGLYLAEGSRAGDTIQIAGNANEADARVERLRAIAKHYGGSLAFTVNENNLKIRMYGRVLVAIVETYIGGTIAKNKHLKVAAWRLPNSYLRQVIQGYLDGDGHRDEANDRYRLGFTRNYHLERDLRTAAARLGAVVTITPTTVESFGKFWPIFRGEWRWDRIGSPRSRDRSQVVEIRQSRARQFWDIAVEDNPHLFSLASGVLTHNCMPESVTDRPGTACEEVFLLTKRADYFFDMEAVKKASAQPLGVPVLTGQHKRGELQGLNSSTLGANYGPDTRNFRNSDLWFDSVGMLLSDTGDMLGLDVPVKGLKAAHFAVMPEALVEPLILAGTSARGVCPQCGEPWTRIVEKERKATRPGDVSKVYKPNGSKQDGVGKATYVGFNERCKEAKEVGNRDPERHTTTTRTVGWEAGCNCEAGEPVPAVVMDPFTGAGTVAKVAVNHGRRFIGCELNEEYLGIIRKRMSRVTPPLPGVTA